MLCFENGAPCPVCNEGTIRHSVSFMLVFVPIIRVYCKQARNRALYFMEEIKIIQEPITLTELRMIGSQTFDNFIKAVVDVQKGIMAVGGALHADEERLLLEQGSRQEDVWGINLYPDKSGDERIEFNSMINLRPSSGNASRGVESEEMRQKITATVERLIRE